MADYQLDSNGKNINYVGAGDPADAFLNGANPGADNTYYPKVDMSLWDQATMCATCHVGGVFYERDRQGMRLPQRAWNDMMETMQAMQGVSGKVPQINPITSTVWENFIPATGANDSFVASSPWLYPAFSGNDPVNGTPMLMPFGMVPVQAGQVAGDPSFKMPNNNGSHLQTGTDAYQLYAGQLMVPNVKEMDCLFCHYTGYDNIPSSVMTQAGSLSAAPAAGAGLFDMTPISPSYMGYNPNNGKVAFTTVKGTPLFTMMTSAAKAMNWPAYKAYSSHQMVTLTSVVTNNIVAKPSDNNCMQCHATKTLTNLPEMFGATGTSSGFLSSAPMIYDPSNPSGPNGKRMVAYDINTLFALFNMGTDPAITGQKLMATDGSAAQYMMGTLPWPKAMGKTPFNQASWNDPGGFIGGNNISGGFGMAAPGPLYYFNISSTYPDLNHLSEQGQDQNVLKRSVMPFARAEWFKRGDSWQDGADVHTAIGCGGCHYTNDTMLASGKKNQCDPGRGFDTASGIQDSVPPLQNGNVLNDYGPNGERVFANGANEILAATKRHDTRNTVKRCEFCHVPVAPGLYTDYYGTSINNYGAPNPTAKHQALGLAGPNADGSGPGPVNARVQMVDHFNLHGNYGGKGTPRETNFTSDDQGTVTLSGGSTGTAGGTLLNQNGNHLDVIDCTVCHVNKVAMAVRSLDATSGMRFPAVIGTDPSKGMFGMFEDPTGMGAANTGMGGALQQWKPLVMWQANGNKILPLDLTNPGNHTNFDFRRKLHLTNSITAILFNNEGSTIDANGDGAKGGALLPNKDSLLGRKDIFSGDTPDENNTQGFGLPIFDPWPQRELKAGMNFAPAPLSVISIGFGRPGVDPYGSIYDASGNFASPLTQYASIWSGAFVFTEPAQFAAYKTMRGNNWNNTTFTMVGAPFMVTHGVKPTAKYALGKSCADCHAPGKGFFKGSFDMIGPAIPASTNFDPTAQLALDAFGNIQVNPVTGEPIRNQGMGINMEQAMTMMGSPFAGHGLGNSMLARPLEPVRIKAETGTLRGYLEATNKLGQPREVNFVHQTTGAAPVYDYASTVDRYEAMYPPNDGAIYYAISDVDPVTHLPKANAAAKTGVEYASYLETIGAAPASALIGTIGGSTPIAGSIPGVTGLGVTIPAGTIHFVAGGTANPALTYTWTFSDLPLTDPVTGVSNALTGNNVVRTFSAAKSFYANLIVKNGNTGVTVTTRCWVKVTTAAPAVSVIGAITTTAGVTTVPVTVAAPHTRIYVTWGDNTEQSFMDSSATTQNLTHKYATSGVHTGSVKVLNGGLIVGTQVLTLSTP